MEKLREELYQRGASLVGYGLIENYYGRSTGTDFDTQEFHKIEGEIPHYPVGISIAIAIPKEVIKGISEKPTMDYYHTYKELNQRLNSLAEFCKRYLMDLGYEAYAQTANRSKEYGNYKTVMPHKTVAVTAGLGWIGKSALLVTKEYGSAVRLTSVLTTAPLSCSPSILDSPCRQCEICKKACPGKAITGNEWDPEKGREWIFDALACRKRAREIALEELDKVITLCGKCIEICPYTQRYLRS